MPQAEARSSGSGCICLAFHNGRDQVEADPKTQTQKKTQSPVLFRRQPEQPAWAMETGWMKVEHVHE